MIKSVTELLKLRYSNSSLRSLELLAQRNNLRFLKLLCDGLTFETEARIFYTMAQKDEGFRVFETFLLQHAIYWKQAVAVIL